MKKRSWMPGSRAGSRNTSQEFSQPNSAVAWVATGNGNIDYPLTCLKNGERVMFSAGRESGLGADFTSGTRALG
jgi:hypothetical protein